MIIDMHVHTEASLDSNATVEAYCRAIERYREQYPFDGLVITEHRLFFPNEAYDKLSDKYGVLILQGVEVDASLGHLLLYGITDEFLKYVDISSRSVKEHEAARILRDCGGIAIPAHPYRESVFGSAFEQGLDNVQGMNIIEELNGANSGLENEKAQQLVQQNGLKGIGGSDAHYVNKHWFLTCATEFTNPVETMEDLVTELYGGAFQAGYLDNSFMGDF